MDEKHNKSQEKAEEMEAETNKPLPWPYQAKEARDRTAELAAKIDFLLTPIIEGKAMTDADQVRKIAQADIAAKEILRHMEAQGAQTRPG